MQYKKNSGYSQGCWYLVMVGNSLLHNLYPTELNAFEQRFGAACDV